MKKNIKKAMKEYGFKQVKELYTGTGYGDIFNAYGRPSVYKVRAWAHCQKVCEDMNGYGLTVTGRNSSFFTEGFKFDYEGETYNAKITASNCYFAKA